MATHAQSNLEHLAQPVSSGGMGFGTMVTSVLFLFAIAGLVIYLTSSGMDQDDTFDA